MSMIKNIKICVKIALVVWKFKKALWYLFSDAPKLAECVSKVSEASDKYDPDQYIVPQSYIASALGTKTLAEFVKATDNKKDDKALKVLIEAVKDPGIFQHSWRLCHGDWYSVKTDSDRWDGFFKKIKKVLPFTNEREAKELQIIGKVVDSAKDTNFTETEETKIAEVTGITVLIMAILPKLIKIIRSVD